MEFVSGLDKYLDSNEFVLIHNDLHFDNIFINDGKIKIIAYDAIQKTEKTFKHKSHSVL